MSDGTASSGRWTRHTPERTHPWRGPGGYFRATPGAGAASPLYGSTQRTWERTAVSVVQAAYRVADAQMEHGARIARSLREASIQQGGAGEPAEALDAGERLARKALLAGVEWLETLVAEPGPLKRVIAAEYRWVGSALGILPTESAAKTGSTPGPHPAQEISVTKPPSPSTRSFAGPVVHIKHAELSARRAASIVRWQVPDSAFDDKTIQLCFFHGDKPGVMTISGSITRGVAGLVLCLNTKKTARSGRWISALVDSNDMQLGIVEIEL